MARRPKVAEAATELLTTRQAAAVLGVGTTSVKRWADAGLLECVKTTGGHRRFPRALIDSFAAAPPTPASGLPEPRAWIELLLHEASSERIADALHVARERLGSWFPVADQLGLVLREIGQQWARGQLSVIQEHIASERLRRALAVCADAAGPGGPATALLATAEGEDHTLGLGLAELCLRWDGWRVLWSGRSTPLYLVRDLVRRHQVALVGLSASAYSQDGGALRDHAQRLAELCAAGGVPLLLGGDGHWPADLEHCIRIRRFAELARLLRTLP
jgi:excisionase family DNA binding protein